MQGESLRKCWTRTGYWLHRHYAIIDKLYKVESEADEAMLSKEERKEKRIRESYSVILEFERLYLKKLHKNCTEKAIEYIFSLLPRLSRYVNNGRVIYRQQSHL